MGGEHLRPCCAQGRQFAHGQSGYEWPLVSVYKYLWEDPGKTSVGSHGQILRQVSHSFGDLLGVGAGPSQLCWGDSAVELIAKTAC